MVPAACTWLPKRPTRVVDALGAKSRRVVYVQYTNPGILPPIQRSAAIFAAQGWSVRFLSIELDGEAERLEVSSVAGIQIERLRRYGAGWRLKLHYLAFVFWCWYRILRIKPALLYVSDPITSPAGVFLSLVTSIPIIYHEHDSPFEVPRDRTEKWLTRSRNFLARHARLCVLPNRLRADVFAKTAGGSAPVWRVMNCPRLSEIPPGSGPRVDSQFRLYYQGSIVPERVPLALLGALMLLPDHVHLVLVGFATAGRPGYVRDLAAEVTARGLESRVKLVGLVGQRDEMLHLCSQHNLGLALMPMRTDQLNLRAMAGASNKIFEYFACGLPVLVSDLPDHRELFVDAGVAKACNPDSAESIADAIRWFLDHAADAVEMGQRARRRIREDWNYEAQFQPVVDFVSSELALAEPAAQVSAELTLD